VIVANMFEDMGAQDRIECAVLVVEAGHVHMSAGSGIEQVDTAILYLRQGGELCLDARLRCDVEEAQAPPCPTQRVLQVDIQKPVAFKRSATGATRMSSPV